MKVNELVDALAVELKVSREKAQAVYDAFCSVLSVALANGEEIQLGKLGKLKSHLRPAAAGRPRLESQLGRNIIEVTFHQFKSSRAGLLDLCRFQEELFDDESEPEE